MKPVGYFNTPRSLFNHPMFEEEPMTQREALMWLIASAAYEPTRVRVKNGRSWEGITLQRGQLSFSRSFLTTNWKWSSEQKVRTFLERLQREGFIEIQANQQTEGQRNKFPPIITICNYNIYPFVRPIEEPRKDPQLTSNQPATNQQTNRQSGHRAPVQAIENKDVLKLPTPKLTIKEPANWPQEEELKESKSAPEGFEDWYAVYPRKKSRADAERAFSKIFPSLVALPALMEKTRSFAASWEGKPEAERKYIPYPASWLNAGSYDDEPEGTKPAPVVRDPRTYTDADWQKRLDHLRDCDTWVEDRWGPRPGEPGCLVPSHLLLATVSKGAA